MYFFEEETFEERCKRELQLLIMEVSIKYIENSLKEVDKAIETRMYLPLFCELIAMGTYLKHKNLAGYIVFTERKYPKPLHKLTFDHNGKDYKVVDLIDIRLKELNLGCSFNDVFNSFKRLNIQKKRPNKYLNIDLTI